MAHEETETKLDKNLERAYGKIDRLAGAILGSQDDNTLSMRILKKTGILTKVANLRESVQAEMPEKEPEIEPEKEPENLPEINFEPLLEEMKPVKVKKKNRKIPQDYKRKMGVQTKKKTKARKKARKR